MFILGQQIMPKIEGASKDELLCTRVTPLIKEAVINESQMEGLTASEWLRNLIVKELKKRGVLQRVYRFPNLEKPGPEP
jgi:hypothetical protein